MTFEAFSVSSSGSLNNNAKSKYDAHIIMKKLKRKFPGIKFEVKPCYDNSPILGVWIDNDTHPVYPGTHEFLMNSWNINSYGYKGVHSLFAAWLKKNGLEFTWTSDSGHFDGIMIKPIDFKEHYAYYGKPVIEKSFSLSDEEKEFNQKTIEKFKEKGFDAHIPKGKFNKGDRTEVEIIEHGMDIRFYVMKGRGFSGPDQTIDMKIKRYHDIMNRHGKLVIEMYNFLRPCVSGPLWMMPSGGGELQAFYGTDSGYIGTLHLSMERHEDQDRRMGGKYVFAVNDKHYDQFFKGYKSKEISILTYKKLWGND